MQQSSFNNKRTIVASASSDMLVDIRNLGISFISPRGSIEALKSVSFSIRPGRTLALVGESGSGKSTTGLALMRLHDKEEKVMLSGDATLTMRDGSRENLLTMSERKLRAVRGREIAMVFQEPMSSLNPIYTVGTQICEALSLHERLSRSEARTRASDLLAQLGVPDPVGAIHRYPHELSGGMRQRVMIAIALACSPRLLIADEPTTALDVTIQAQILELLAELQARTGMAMLFITHNLGVVREIAHDVAVMYGGSIVEAGPVDDVFGTPRMPYTQALLRSLPTLSGSARQKARLEAIRGSIPSPHYRPSGCYFHPRCDHSLQGLCDATAPVLERYGTNHSVACHRSREISEGREK